MNVGTSGNIFIKLSCIPDSMNHQRPNIRFGAVMEEQTLENFVEADKRRSFQKQYFS